MVCLSTWEDVVMTDYTLVERLDIDLIIDVILKFCACAHAACVEEGGKELWGRKCDVVTGFTNVHVNMHVYHATLTHYTDIDKEINLFCLAYEIPVRSINEIESHMDNGKSLPAFGVETQTHSVTAGFSSKY